MNASPIDHGPVIMYDHMKNHNIFISRIFLMSMCIPIRSLVVNLHRASPFCISDAHPRITEIRPGIIETDMTSVVKEKYDTLIGDGLTPIRRWGQPDDIARAVVAIAEGYLPFSTGEVINVDGGFSAW